MCIQAVGIVRSRTKATEFSLVLVFRLEGCFEQLLLIEQYNLN